MRKMLILVFALLATTSSAEIAEGDRHWEGRADGHQGGRAMAAPIDAAIAAYQRAVTQNPDDLEARWKLLRAMRFKGAYVASNNNEKKEVYDRAKKAGQEAIAVVDRQLSAKGVKPVSKANDKQVAGAAKTIPGAAEVLLWDAVNWGEWALAYGKMAAAREGAADRIRRQATMALLVDPTIDGGTPGRVLGRLHHQTPRIPFITGWASGREAVRFLGESLRIDPKNKVTIVFLAEAMVSNDPKTRARAVSMLREVVNTPPDPAFEVEQTAAQSDARALLRKWGV
jgi:tetratricopeptide (TPR) repeat protein